MEAPILTSEVIAALPAELAAFVQWFVDENRRLQDENATLKADNESNYCKIVSYFRSERDVEPCYN